MVEISNQNITSKAMQSTSEQFGKKEVNMSNRRKTKTADNTKNLAFDTLDEKIGEGIKKLTLKDDAKVENKYTSPGDEPDSRKKLLRKDKLLSASLGYNSDANTENKRSNSIEKGSSDTVGFGLYEAASVMCNIVPITKDSTMVRKIVEMPHAPTTHPKPSKTGSKSSLTSQSSQSGPFATMKENAEKKKKSFDQEDD